MPASALIARWAHDAKQNPQHSQLVLAYTRDDVKALNHRDPHPASANRPARAQPRRSPTETRQARFRRQRPHPLPAQRTRPRREERLAWAPSRASNRRPAVKLDGAADTRVAVDTKFYKHLDYGYAATVHKAQGTTVDRTYVLASRHFDRHTSYVALSRHREEATLFWGREEFAGRAGQGASNDAVEAKRNFEAVLRARDPKSSPTITSKVGGRVRR